MSSSSRTRRLLQVHTPINTIQWDKIVAATINTEHGFVKSNRNRNRLTPKIFIVLDSVLRWEGSKVGEAEMRGYEHTHPKIGELERIHSAAIPCLLLLFRKCR